MSQDRSGTNYERLLAASLQALGFEYSTGDVLATGAADRVHESGQAYMTTPKRYVHPSASGKPIIPGTYIQPDLVMMVDERVTAVVYSTHWSNTRDSKRKFWRTWEEAAQQKVVLGPDILSINGVFEALPQGSDPGLYVTSDDLPTDKSRAQPLPMQLNGWDPGIGWALLEAFDVSIVFPVGYAPVVSVRGFVEGEHDEPTSLLLDQALSRKPKAYLRRQWSILATVRTNALVRMPEFEETHSRYRIGLLHVYMAYKLLCRIATDIPVDLREFVTALTEEVFEIIELEKLAKKKPFKDIEISQTIKAFEAMSSLYVRAGRNPQMLCNVTEVPTVAKPQGIHKLRLNDDLRTCLQDLRVHVGYRGFVDVLQRTFDKFDEAYGVEDALDDLASDNLVESKERFVREHLADVLADPDRLRLRLQAYADASSQARRAVSTHGQNWVLEMILYVAGLNSAEDIQTLFKEYFERSGHKLRPHAPYGGHAQLVAFLLQGRDVCEQWSSEFGRRTLSSDEFRALCWKTIADVIAQRFSERGSDIYPQPVVIAKYLQNKSMRIISSDLNGFYIMVEHYLGDLCDLKFSTEKGKVVEAASGLSQRICPSWQTDVVQEVWGSRPLETWMEGVSKNGKWLIKVQSAQDGHQMDKTKELAGRSRGIHVAWYHDDDPHDRTKWSFGQRDVKKMALVLDGDWEVDRKRNLYEAGWDWVGDIGQLDELRQIIQADSDQ
jgi:hypothetical protein